MSKIFLFHKTCGTNCACTKFVGFVCMDYGTLAHVKFLWYSVDVRKKLSSENKVSWHLHLFQVRRPPSAVECPACRPAADNAIDVPVCPNMVSHHLAILKTCYVPELMSVVLKEKKKSLICFITETDLPQLQSASLQQLQIGAINDFA